MSTSHSGGNIQNTITLEEHDGSLNAKRVSLVSAVTIFASVTPTSFLNILVSTASGQRTQFPDQASRWAIIQGNPVNTTNTYIGTSGVSATVNGFPLAAGQMTGVEISNLNQLWLANATGASSSVLVIGGN